MCFLERKKNTNEFYEMKNKQSQQMSSVRTFKFLYYVRALGFAREFLVHFIIFNLVAQSNMSSERLPPRER